MDFTKAFKKPFTDMKKLGIGVVLSIFPVISWFARGFTFECSGLGKARKSDNMPEWKDWGDLFFKGFVSRLLAFIYMLPAAALAFMGAGKFFFSIIMPCFPSNFPFIQGHFDPGPCIEQSLMGGGFGHLLGLAPYILLSFLLMLLALYLLPIAILNFIKTDKFGSAFELSKIARMAFSGDYFVLWLITHIVAVILGLLLMVIPFFGPVFAFFVVNVFAYTLYGEVYRDLSKKK